ncbi:MAG: DUF2007 domain-containing protein [SAR324 cluster bacterium]|nr:DUF2007 domain-containing protein [SAR324 cluster bacterium]
MNRPRPRDEPGMRNPFQTPMNDTPPARVLLEKLLDRVEAFALVHYLDAHGIPVSLSEPPLRSALGEIPFLETAAELFLDDPSRWNDARALIDRYRSGASAVRGTVWTCPDCGERHEPEFGECWSCGRVRS